MDEMLTAKPCQTECLGYTCDRPNKHGSLHRHRDPDGTIHWWLLAPYDEAERRGEKRFSNYVLLHDSLLDTFGG